MNKIVHYLGLDAHKDSIAALDCVDWSTLSRFATRRKAFGGEPPNQKR